MSREERAKKYIMGKLKEKRKAILRREVSWHCSFYNNIIVEEVVYTGSTLKCLTRNTLWVQRNTCPMFHFWNDTVKHAVDLVVWCKNRKEFTRSEKVLTNNYILNRILQGQLATLRYEVYLFYLRMWVRILPILKKVIFIFTWPVAITVQINCSPIDLNFFFLWKLNYYTFLTEHLW